MVVFLADDGFDKPRWVSAEHAALWARASRHQAPATISSSLDVAVALSTSILVSSVRVYPNAFRPGRKGTEVATPSRSSSNTPRHLRPRNPGRIASRPTTGKLCLGNNEGWFMYYVTVLSVSRGPVRLLDSVTPFSAIFRVPYQCHRRGHWHGKDRISSLYSTAFRGPMARGGGMNPTTVRYQGFPSWPDSFSPSNQPRPVAASPRSYP